MLQLSDVCMNYKLYLFFSLLSGHHELYSLNEMPYSVGTSYSFISNNLRCGTVDSVIIPMPQRDQMLTSKVIIPLKSARDGSHSQSTLIGTATDWEIKCNPRGPAERRLRTASTLNRLRSSLSSDAVRLEFMSTSAQNDSSLDQFSSRESSPSSSSSVPLSPASSANVPLLQKTRSKSVQRLISSRLTDRSDAKTNTKKQKRNKPVKTRGNLDYFTCGTVLKPVTSPTNSIGHTARRMWTALERKFSQSGSSTGGGHNQHARMLQSSSDNGLDQINEHQRSPETFELCVKKRDGRNTRLLEMLAKEGINVTDIDDYDHGDPCERLLSKSSGLVRHDQMYATRTLPHSKSLNFPREHCYPWQGLDKPNPLVEPCAKEKVNPCKKLTSGSSIAHCCKHCHQMHSVVEIEENAGSRRLKPISSAVPCRWRHSTSCPIRPDTIGHSGAPCHLQTLSSQCYIPKYALHVLSHRYPIPEIREVVLTRPEGMHRFGMRIESIGRGVYLTTVLKNSPAAAAGLKVGDELIQLNGFPVASLSTHTIMELVRSTPHNLHVAYRPRLSFGLFKQGLFVDVVLPYSAASQAGIKEGDELLRVNNQSVNGWSQDSVSQMLREIPPEQTLKLYVKQLLPLRELIQNARVEETVRCSNACQTHGTSAAAKSNWAHYQALTADSLPHHYDSLIPDLGRDNCHPDQDSHCHHLPDGQQRTVVGQTAVDAVENPGGYQGIQKLLIDPLAEVSHSTTSGVGGQVTNHHDLMDSNGTASHSPFRMINSLSDWTIGQNANEPSGDI
ncbi:unnamed protein product [Echinostoma caproni]|uniref:PDZ domain-containing protein n=1 Tax=Echinostoma caproni TaxID=27848 RepID=A0A183ABU4_9TREM|nr:unnamed protein product [Echinostoma caproni]